MKVQVTTIYIWLTIPTLCEQTFNYIGFSKFPTLHINYIFALSLAVTSFWYTYINTYGIQEHRKYFKNIKDQVVCASFLPIHQVLTWWKNWDIGEIVSESSSKKLRSTRLENTTYESKTSYSYISTFLKNLFSSLPLCGSSKYFNIYEKMHHVLLFSQKVGYTGPCSVLKNISCHSFSH